MDEYRCCFLNGSYSCGYLCTVFNNIFNTLPLGLAQWEVIVPLLFVPSVAAEVTKVLFSPTRKQFL